METYNSIRPHDSIQGMSPYQFARARGRFCLLSIGPKLGMARLTVICWFLSISLDPNFIYYLGRSGFFNDPRIKTRNGRPYVGPRPGSPCSNENRHYSGNEEIKYPIIPHCDFYGNGHAHVSAYPPMASLRAGENAVIFPKFPERKRYKCHFPLLGNLVYYSCEGEFFLRRGSFFNYLGKWTYAWGIMSVWIFRVIDDENKKARSSSALIPARICHSPGAATRTPKRACTP
jgi:hypothetical protein